MAGRKTKSGGGGGELSGERVFRGLSRAKAKSSRQRGPKVEVWRGRKFSGDEEQCFVWNVECRGRWSLRMKRQVRARALPVTLSRGQWGARRRL